MPRITDLNIFETKEQPTLVIRKTVPVQKLPEIIGQSYQQIADYLARLGQSLADMPFVAYQNMDMQALQVEIGFPVSQPLPGHENIEPGIIPGGKQVFCMFLGPYHLIEPVYKEMLQWIQNKNYVLAGASYEYYYNAPDEVSQEHLLTRVAFPVRPK